MSPINELELTRFIRRLFGGGDNGSVSLGIGDDCAAVRAQAGLETLVTCDTLCEGTHFAKPLIPPAKLGAKLVCVSVSDIAAMGGVPRYLVLAMNLTGEVDKKWIESFLRGVRKASRKFECALIGGNIAIAAKGLSFTMTAIGAVKKGRRVDRSGARPGDRIFVTGTLGDSALGLDLLLEKRKSYSAAQRKLINRHIDPTPRLKAGALLGSERIASSMIDVSDGVALDLRRLAEASGVSAAIELAGFPLSKQAGACLDANGPQVWQRILGGGEDYELLFTVRPSKLGKLAQAAGRFDTPVRRIGSITKERKPRLKIIGPGGVEPNLASEGWLHSL